MDTGELSLSKTGVSERIRNDVTSDSESPINYSSSTNTTKINHCDSEMQKSQCTDTPSTSNTKADQRSTINLEGRRIVDIQFFISELVKFSGHSPQFGCSLANLVILKEERNGFISILPVQCNMCNEKFKIPTSQLTDDNVNSNAVLGIMTIGSGFAHLEQICASLDIPCISEKLYSSVHEHVCNLWEATAIKYMKEAAEEERALAIADGDVDQSGTPLITVVADGTWAKRSYGNTYDSLSGAAAIIGYRTKKVLFLGVRNRFCTICSIAEKNNSGATSHKCYKNWSGSAAGMESDIIAEGFQKSLEMYNLIYHKVIADGDSSTFKKILDIHPYPNLKVEKIECKNHLLRNYSKKIRELVKDTKSGPLILRKKLEQNQLRLRWAIDKAIKHWKNETNLSLSEKIVNLKRDIENSVSHVFGEHKNCKLIGYFCEKPFEENQSLIKDLKLTDLYEKLCSYRNYLIRHASSLIHDVDNNSVEQFNSIIAKFIGGKRINYCKKRSYQSRCAAAVVSHNTRMPIYLLRKELNEGRTPSTMSKKLELRRIKKNKKQKCIKRLFKKQKSKSADGSESYGIICQKPDMDEMEYNEAKKRFLEQLEKTPDGIKEIEYFTRGQANTALWYIERRKRLTASFFGLVCRRRDNTSCQSLVESILYPKTFYSAACEYGKQNECIAVEQLERRISKKIIPCGLFVDNEHFYLAASPDGLINDRGIVEIKCPFSAKDLTPDEGIRQRKITFWHKNGEINKKHKWYYQIQGQLKITNRSYCVLAVWTPHGMKIETLFRDYTFWSSMEQPLAQFYFNCLLPELVDSRKARNMPIKDPNYIVEAIQRKLKK